jgi:hypothetical protein
MLGQQFNVLQQVKQDIKKKEGKIYKTAKGWRYDPSPEYKLMKESLNRKNELTVTGEFKKPFWDALDKLNNLDKAFDISVKSNRKVSHVSNGKIILVAR